MTQESKQSWVLATIIDGAIRTVSTIFQNLTGHSISSWHGALGCNFVIEIVRTFSGAAALALKRQSFKVSPRQLRLLGIWALFATLMTCLHIASYEQGADQGIAVLALQTSIIWGVLFDWVFFSNKPTKGQCAGVGLLLLATYAAVDFPGLIRTDVLPWWVWIKLLIAFMLGINEMTRRKLAAEVPGETRINPVVSSFYVGAISLTFLVPLIIANSEGVFQSMSLAFLLSSAVLGWLVVISTVLSLIPYLAGSNILLRKFFGNATALVLSIASGAIIFGEAITIGKILGVGLVIGAFLLVDRERLLVRSLRRSITRTSPNKNN